MYNFLLQDEVATLRRSKFSTLRTTKLISREHEEYQRENNMYEQMDGYKRLRQTHHKELKQVSFIFALLIAFLPYYY